MQLTLMPMKALRLDGPSPDLWLLLCTLVGIAFWWLSLRMDPWPPQTAAAPVELAIGRGLPLLSTELELPTRGISHLDDVDDVAAAVADGIAQVGIDAGPSGVRILHRPLGDRRVPTLAVDLGQRWERVETRVLVDVWHPQRLALLLALLLVLHVGVQLVRQQQRHLQDGQWLRWLVVQGAGVPVLMVGLLARQCLHVGVLGGFAYVGLLGLSSMYEVLPLVGVLALCSVWLAVLLTVTRRSRFWLWLAVHATILVGGLGVSDPGIGMASTIAPILISLILLLGTASVGLAPRLAEYLRGGTP